MTNEKNALFSRLGIDNAIAVSGPASADRIEAFSPVDGASLGFIHVTQPDDYEAAITRAEACFQHWRSVPAPRRGVAVRLLGEALRSRKEDLAHLVTLECGKILTEARGEVQEMIDICEFAVGLSRQLYGLTIASERPGHHLREAWHPVGPTGIISAFNFPVAVWSWNAALALVCGNPCVWKPSEKTPLTALAVQSIFDRALESFDDAPSGLSQVIIGEAELGNRMAEDARLPLLSATGSCAMGRKVGPKVAARFGRSLLELGGNNAAIITPSADIDQTVRAVAFAAAGTAGQRCTSLRRLFVHDEIYDDVVTRLKNVYQQLSVGNPLHDQNLVGPLIDDQALMAMEQALTQAKAAGGTVFGGARTEPMPDGASGGVYVTPALVEMPGQGGVVLAETFAPILYIMRYGDLDEAIKQQNAAAQGLSSSIFTLNIREAEQFLSASGSDCGIANVNIGPSGAEIGGAFGGEKETGGGRESGSDAWKAYMRRQTQTVNYSDQLPLAQGVRFDIG